MNSSAKERRIGLRYGNENGTEHSLQSSLNDSLEGEIQAFLTDEDKLHTYDDLTKINPVTTTTVLKCLQARYKAKVFYTHAGCSLVALNPFQPMPHLYRQDVMKQYHFAPQPQELKPHIFIMAEEAYRNVQGQLEPVNQSLVVSGESGAGKTWTSRCLMKYYASVAASSSVTKSQGTVEKIERRVLDSNPLMEAFGNACTLRNNNSSRFGKYIQLQLDRNQLLVGASVQTYLLEKTRVACQPANERNFHIFYQMMKGATEEQRKEWKMLHGQHFAWLPKTEKEIEEDCIHETLEAMGHLGIDKERQRQIFMVLAGLLQLGNVNVSSSVDESQTWDIEKESKDFLEKAAELLCVPFDELWECLRVRTLKAGKQSILKPCSQAECRLRRDCLAKVTYARLFEWLVKLVNKSISADKSMWCNFIGILDVYGFECFQKNLLEQLCINYANEKLQQHFVAHYLRAQQDEYVSEGLQWSFVKYQDNQSCLDLIEGSPSIFSLLNETSRLNRTPDAKTLRVRLEMELCNNTHISWNKFSNVPHFTVAHYAGQVDYHLEGMVEKNKDPVPPELISLLQKSENVLLREIFINRDTDRLIAKDLNKITVVSKFKNSLENLMKILNTTTPHYTRCIKPNRGCRPLTFKKKEVLMQLTACGIVETIHISAAGFPIRIPFRSFVRRYGLRAKHSGFRFFLLCPSVNSDLQQQVEQLLCEASPSNDTGHNSWGHCGRTKVFLTQSMLDLLEHRRKKILSQCAFTVQCCWLRHQRRKRQTQQRSATLIQAAVRSWLVRRKVRRYHRAAVVIQNSWRRWKDLLKSLAESEIDDVEDLTEANMSSVNFIGGQASVQLPTLQEPVTVRGWPVGLALASAASVIVSLTPTDFQKMISMISSLNLQSTKEKYRVETNQYTKDLASIRAQPRIQGSVKLHFQQSPLLHADMRPDFKSDITGFNEILLERISSFQNTKERLH
ncbi:unconventional myosin-XIX isoform X2 [Cynoglossus semilaevis]|uniref:unconventional myosin-XIX isoform X2 n=1 Tax=Cynoglossus semilaevis TaxID=244447 RepID=UPI000D623F71|nr:unconventional myosin-XIX isoform X2 [Cynoglossus semilaevis]